MTTTAQMMTAATQLMRDAMSIWTPPVLAAGSLAARTPAVEPEPVQRQPSQSQPSRPVAAASSWYTRPQTERAGSEPSPRLLPAYAPAPVLARPPASASSSSARSWYRPPYRSPFDPLFWVMPGHPVDHVQDWLPAAAAMMTAGAAQYGLARSAPARSAMFAQAPQWPMADLWLAPWKAMQAGASMTSPAVAAMGGGYPTANVIDFDQAYAAYRTAGGHAAAQIVRSFAGVAQASSAPARSSPSPQWLNPFDPFGLFAR